MGAPLWQRPRGEWDVTTRTGFELLEGGLAALSQPVGRVFFSPGQEIAWDTDCQGMLWVRIAEITDPPEARKGRFIGRDVTYGLGGLRCVATVDNQGRPPSPTEMTRDALVLQTDRLDLECFLAEHTRAWGMVWTPDGPEGGAAVGEWLFTLRVGVS